MSTQQVTSKAKDTLKSVKEMLEKAEESVHKELTKAAPKVSKTLDTSMDAASKGFQSTIKTIDTRTEKEQLALLQGYRKFLAGQLDYVDSRIRGLEKGRQEQAPAK